MTATTLSTVHDRLAGIHAATIVPMTTDYLLDEAELADHLTSVAQTPGMRGLLVNGHAGENFVLNSAEKRRVIEIARSCIPVDSLLCSGINAESSLEAARDAAAAEAAGADILLIFPPNSFALDHDRRCALIHQAHIRDACGLPLLLYGASIGAGTMAYPPDLLLELAADERVVGIKEGSWEVAAYEATWRLFADRRDSFAVLGSGDEHLLASYMVGSHGSQVSLAALAPSLIVALSDAAAASDWSTARALHERVYPLARAIYREAPGGRATARLKAALMLLGKAASDTVRPPQPPPDDNDYQMIDSALRAAGLMAPDRERKPDGRL